MTFKDLKSGFPVYLLDTAYKDRQATETRFQRIDERFSGMESKIDRILEAMGRKEE